MGFELPMQPLPEARVHGVKVHVFEGQAVGRAIRTILTATALGLADA
jgi:hypothetical protein